MKSKGQIEDSIAKKAIQFYREALGVGPQQSKAYILHDMVIVRLKSKLLPHEEMLLGKDRGIEIVKDIRRHIHESTIPGMSELIQEITIHKVISTHSDISTKTGEILQIFILDSDFEEQLGHSE
ncbi:MAG: DUF2294 domain-containing protein [Weeksellaceae bacterium]